MLAVLAWWLIVTLMGWTAFPIAMRLFNRLPGRGYALSKALGLLLVSYVFWLLCSFKLLANNVGGILIAWVIVLSLSLAFYLRREGNLNALREFVRARWRYILAAEVIFLVGLVGWAVFRSFDPDLVGTEKPMEFAFLNAILRSDTFPPHDPWLSGYAISYYYYGYVIVAMLTKLAATAPAVAFNVGIALLFALTLTGSFGVVYELIRGAKDRESEGRAIGFGLFGPLFVALAGNLEGLLDALHTRGIGTAQFWSWVQINELATAPVTGAWIPQDHWWWWRASRVVYDTNLLGQYSQIIDEFPYFSFILGDMHPHVLALPFIMLAAALAVQIVRWAAGQKPLALPQKGAGWAWLRAWLAEDWERTLLVALCLGALGFLNLWDFPTYWGLATLCYAAGRYLAVNGLGKAFWADVVLWSVRTLILGVLLFLPFYVGFGSQASGIGLVLINKTRPLHYFVMFGLFLVSGVAFAVYVTSVWLRGRKFSWTGDVKTIGAVVAFLVILSAFTGRWTALVVALLVGMLVLAATRQLAQMADAKSADETALNDVAASLIMVVGFLLTFAVEYVFLKDYFGTRTNTVFKFYYQAWVLLAIGGAYALWAILGRGLREKGSGALFASGVFFALFLIVQAFMLFYLFRQAFFKGNWFWYLIAAEWIMLAAAAVSMLLSRRSGAPMKRATIARGVLAAPVVILLAASLVYTVAAGYSRANGFRGKATLDCLDFVRQYNAAEYDAIGWLNANVKGTPVILEATGGSYTEYARISARTGLPTVLGWDFHEQQWRGRRNPAGSRAQDVEAIYRAPDSPESLTRLDSYGITYIYVGDLERNKYGLSESLVNRWDKIAEQVYDQGGVRIYRYVPEQSR
jgi:YYY domain-containing protein